MRSSNSTAPASDPAPAETDGEWVDARDADVIREVENRLRTYKHPEDGRRIALLHIDAWRQGRARSRRPAETDGLAERLRVQREWSRETFGPGDRLRGLLDHIRKELNEVEENPTDVTEWIDVVILAFDGAWRAGYEPEQIVAALDAKYAKNRARTWPDWRTADPNAAIEHVPTALLDVAAPDHHVCIEGCEPDAHLASPRPAPVPDTTRHRPQVGTLAPGSYGIEFDMRLRCECGAPWPCALLDVAAPAPEGER